MIKQTVELAKEEFRKVLDSPSGPVIREAIGGLILALAGVLVTVATERRAADAR